MPKLSKVACRLSPSQGLLSEHSERGQKNKKKNASYGCGNARGKDKRTEERELCVDETRLKINKANVCNNKIYAHYVIWGGGSPVSAEAHVSTCTHSQAHVCTYTQTHTNPVFQRAQLPEQHRWRTATWRADPDSPPRQTYYRYIECMIHRKKDPYCIHKSHKHAHTKKEAIEGETLF